MSTEQQVKHGRNGEVTGLRAEHDLTLHELADTLDELAHRTDIRQRSKQAAHNAVVRTRHRAMHAAQRAGKRLLALTSVLAASCGITYAVVRMLRKKRRARPWHRLGLR